MFATSQSEKLWPIFVPSKGRPQSSTLKLLREHGIEHNVVVEPQELENYKLNELGPPISFYLALPENDRGIAYVRNMIKRTAGGAGMKWYWMLDDDITRFYLAIGGKNSASNPLTVLLEAQRIFSSLPLVGQGALEYQQFSWSAKKDFAIGYCDVAVAINADRTLGIEYRQEMDLKEDRDFTLQILANGMLTVRASKCGFSAPKNGSNKGGLYEEYQKDGREEQASRRMEAAWPGICKYQPKKDGRPDVKINWSVFRPKK